MPDTSSHTLNIGEKLRAARKSARMSLRDLADKSEMSASMLSQIEHGKAYPSVRSLYSIAAALSLPVDYFFPTENSREAVNAGALPGMAGDMTASELREATIAATAEGAAVEFQAAPHPSLPVVHRAARPTIELKGGVTWARLTARSEEGVEFLEITYAPGATSGANMSHHEGREFGLILEGVLIVELGFERYALHAGDSIVFDSTTPHRLTNAGDQPVQAIWVVLDRK
ncbi:MAG TPA: cupin domain-containing protein [Anaerolineae bacterium]|nr:cupin domain-containing protein [Anaerolineae bacterium]